MPGYNSSGVHPPLPNPKSYPYLNSRWELRLGDVVVDAVPAAEITLAPPSKKQDDHDEQQLLKASLPRRVAEFHTLGEFAQVWKQLRPIAELNASHLWFVRSWVVPPSGASRPGKNYRKGGAYGGRWRDGQPAGGAPQPGGHRKFFPEQAEIARRIEIPKSWAQAERLRAPAGEDEKVKNRHENREDDQPDLQKKGAAGADAAAAEELPLAQATDIVQTMTNVGVAHLLDLGLEWRYDFRIVQEEKHEQAFKCVSPQPQPPTSRRLNMDETGLSIEEAEGLTTPTNEEVVKSNIFDESSVSIRLGGPEGNKEDSEQVLHSKAAEEETADVTAAELHVKFQDLVFALIGEKLGDEVTGLLVQKEQKAGSADGQQDELVSFILYSTPPVDNHSSRGAAAYACAHHQLREQFRRICRMKEYPKLRNTAGVKVVNLNSSERKDNMNTMKNLHPPHHHGGS
eukprot:g5656.t1